MLVEPRPNSMQSTDDGELVDIENRADLDHVRVVTKFTAHLDPVTGHRSRLSKLAMATGGHGSDSTRRLQIA
jgi:hypothetical protein